MIDELTTHTDTGRQELIHPYKTLYGRDLNSVLKDNLGDSWDAPAASGDAWLPRFGRRI